MMVADENAQKVIRFRTSETIRVTDPIEIDLDRRVVQIGNDESDLVDFGDLKAIFFVGPQKGAPPGARASHLTIEFDDGEVLSGAAPEYNPTLPGFYLYPEGEDRVEKVFIVASAIVSIDVNRL